MAEIDEFEILKNEREKRKINERKKLILKIMLDKRIQTAYKNEQQKITDFLAQEDKEELIEEDPRKRGYLNLSQHKKVHKHKNKKKCWVCKSPKHLKKSCPRIRCFYCHRLGHIKATCYERKVNYIYGKLMEDLAQRIKRQEKKKMEELTKDEEIKRQINIMKKRAKEIEYKLEKTEKGEVFVAKLNGITIGNYTGPGLPGPIHEKLKANEFNWGLINRLAERTAPYNVFTLYDGLTNWCQCGLIDLNKRDFIGHVKDHHRGLIMQGCQLNRPPWFDLVQYINDEIEEIICFTEEDLDKSMLDNYLT